MNFQELISVEKTLMPNSHGNGQPHHQTFLECSKEFSEKHKCNVSCMAMASNNQDLKSIKVAFPANISAASNSRPPLKDALSIDLAIRNKNGNEKPLHRNASKVEKGKQPIIYDPDASRSSSNRRKENQEYFDCFNSRDNVSKVKRARIYELESEKFIGSKRLKRLSNGNCSFINWITALTSGLNISFNAPMEAFQNGSQHMKSVVSLPFISDDSREYISVSHGIKGFSSIFQGMYFPGFNASSNKVIYSSLKGTEGDKASRFSFCERLNGQQSCFPASNFSSGENDSTDPVSFDSYDIAPKMNGIECKDKIQDSCVELMTQSRHVSLNSSWIKRFSHGVSSPQQKIMQYSNFLDLSAQKFHSGLVHKVPYLEDQKIRLNGSHGSNNFKRSKPKASFAPRLDALKLTKFLKIKDDDTRDKKICLFCGMRDHTIRECSVVIDTGKEKYLKSNALCDNIKTTSCFCILCYQIGHWAVACSNASYEGNHVSFKATCLVDTNFRIKTAKKHGNHPFFKKDYHQVHHGRSAFQKEKRTSFVDCSKVRSCKNESAVCGSVNFCMDRLNDTVNTDKMKLVTFCSSGGELKKSEFMPICMHSFAATDPKGIFAAVQKLRLSRKDVLRWIKSRAPPYNLGGFFLRLRIGQDKNLRGTSYHVAYINGAIFQNSIYVCVGSSSYSVTSRFISNHDFEEDELKAWWFQSLKDGSKMPSSEELSHKLQLKLKFGF